VVTPVLVHDGPMAQVWHGDAEQVLAEIPTESADLIVTDPPYGQEWQSNQRGDLFGQLDGDGADEDSRNRIRAGLEHCVRIVGQNRHLYVFGPTDVLEGLKVSECVGLVWDKTMMSGGNLAAPWGPQHEPITFAVSKHRHAGKSGASVLPTRLRKGTVLRFERPTGRKVRHPSEKPTALLRELIESSSRQGELVVDPYGGIGSTAVAAVLSGRRALTCDTDERWVQVAVDRVRAAERLALDGRVL
jgi:DNA modification methylase